MAVKALFLGYGRMGGALGEAWMEAGLVQGIDAVDPGRTQPARAGLFRSAAELPDTRYELVVLAVKPAIAAEALRAVPADRLDHACVVSVMAGVCADAIAQALPRPLPVVRSMPNTPVMVGKGCTGLFGWRGVTPALRQMVSGLFEAVGAAYWVEQEEQLHAVTALSGSGPAYYHLFSEALAQAGVQLGLPRDLAGKLAARTALGAAALQCQDGADLASLRQEVTSPNGTTHAAIQAFERDAALRGLVAEAVSSAWRRSIELSRA